MMVAERCKIENDEYRGTWEENSTPKDHVLNEFKPNLFFNKKKMQFSYDNCHDSHHRGVAL